MPLFEQVCETCIIGGKTLSQTSDAEPSTHVESVSTNCAVWGYARRYPHPRRAARVLLRIHFTYMRPPALGVSSRGYTYAGMAYANPDAVTQVANGLQHFPPNLNRGE